MKTINCLTVIFSILIATAGLAGKDAEMRLLSAAAEGKLDIVKTLIKERETDIEACATINGNCVDAQSLRTELAPFIDNKYGAYDMTALHYALRNNRCEIVRYLLQKGAAVDIFAGCPKVSAEQLIEDGHCHDKETRR